MGVGTVVVTGISGFVGQVLLPYLEQEAQVERVIGIDLRPPPVVTGKLTFHRLDIRDPGVDKLLIGADVLVHLAFIMLPSRRHPMAEVKRINVEGTRQLCHLAARQGVRKLVIISSAMAYGLHPDNPIPLTEDSPLRPNPDNHYSWAKGANERFLDTFQAEHPHLLVTRLRPSTIVGPHGPVGQMKPLVGDPAVVIRGADPPYQMLDEEDMARAVHLAISRDLPGVYNVAPDDAPTLRRLAGERGVRVRPLPYGLYRLMLALTWRLGLSAASEEWASLARYPLVLSNEKFKAQGWQPRSTTVQAYARLWDAFHGTRAVEKGGDA